MNRSRRMIALGLAGAVALAAAGLAGCAEAATRKPALATGASDPSATPGGPRARWRLTGRRLTVRLPAALHTLAASRIVTARARCGESTVKPRTSDEIYPWATVTQGSVRVRASARTVRIVMARDLAARTNLCELRVAATSGRGSVGHRAAMSVRRGPKRGCRPGPRERVVHDSDAIRVTSARAEEADGTSIDGYRACRLPRGNLQRVERGGDSGGAGGSATTVARFTSTGVWLTWVTTYLPHSDLGGVPTTTVRRIGLPGGVVSSVDSAPGAVSALAVDAVGVTAWVREPRGIAGAATLQAHAPGGSVVELDRVRPIQCVRSPCEGSGPITDLAVRDRTVRWRNAGVARSATLP